jgi:hypothetical protein
MASNVIDIGSRRRKAFRRNNRLADLIFCPFTLVPGAGGRVLLWWSEERTWIAAFPSLQAAHDFILGKEEGWPRNPGWDRSDTSINVKSALYEQQEKNGKFPQFEFAASSNVFDLYIPLGLGPEALSRLVYYDQYACGYEVDCDLIDVWCPLVAQVLSGGGWGLEPEVVARVAPVMTEILLRTTKHQIELERALDQRLATEKRGEGENEAT